MTASLRGYTTAAKVRDLFAGRVVGYLTDVMIETAITRIEGAIDTKLRVGSEAGAFSFTWATAKSPHWVVEGAATYGAALQICGPNLASLTTLDELINMQNEFSYFFKFFWDMINDEADSSHIQAQ